MKRLYERPVAFWRRVLDDSLHFHLGHFCKPDDSLASSMLTAVNNLVSIIHPETTTRRILDVGCGWGGPAFELARRWNAEVLGITISEEQSHLVNQLAADRGLPIKAITTDIETCVFDEFGTFDVLWLYEVLEHIADRRALLSKLQQVSCETSRLAMTVSCRAFESTSTIYSLTLGVQPLPSLSELIEMLDNTGWRVMAMKDQTALTLPVWDPWLTNLAGIKEPEYRLLAQELAIEFSELKKLYQTGELASIQLVARQATCPT